MGENVSCVVDLGCEHGMRSTAPDRSWDSTHWSISTQQYLMMMQEFDLEQEDPCFC